MRGGPGPEVAVLGWKERFYRLALRKKQSLKLRIVRGIVRHSELPRTAVFAAEFAL